MKGTPWLVAGGTVAGLVAVLSYHTRAMPAAALSGAAAHANAASTAQGPSATQSAAAGKARGAKAGPSAPAGTKTAAGPNEMFGYGELAVDVTVRNGRITNVTVPSLRTAEPTSQQISKEAIPMLTSEVLSAQGLHINAVSGATYTSEAYAQSLQAALDKLHFK